MGLNHYIELPEKYFTNWNEKKRERDSMKKNWNEMKLNGSIRIGQQIKLRNKKKISETFNKTIVININRN